MTGGLSRVHQSHHANDCFQGTFYGSRVTRVTTPNFENSFSMLLFQISKEALRGTFHGHKLGVNIFSLLVFFITWSPSFLRNFSALKTQRTMIHGNELYPITSSCVPSYSDISSQRSLSSAWPWGDRIQHVQLNP